MDRWIFKHKHKVSYIIMAEEKKSKKEKKSEKKAKLESAESNDVVKNTSEVVDTANYTINPETSTPKIDTSKWPLLLKYYDQLHVVCAST